MKSDHIIDRLHVHFGMWLKKEKKELGLLGCELMRWQGLALLFTTLIVQWLWVKTVLSFSVFSSVILAHLEQGAGNWLLDWKYVVLVAVLCLPTLLCGIAFRKFPLHIGIAEIAGMGIVLLTAVRTLLWA